METRGGGLIVQSMVMAATLCCLKAGVGLATGSLSVLASALDSLADLCSSLVNYVSMQVAHSPADREHQYGHGKAEALAGLFQGSFIAFGALALMAESARRMMAHTPLVYHHAGVAVMLVSTVASFVHSQRLRRAAAREESSILSVESAHFVSDVAANLGIIGALALVGWTGEAAWDLGVTVAVAAYILWTTWPILHGAVSELMDEGLPEEVRRDLEVMIRAHHPSVVGFHDFRSRRAGGLRFVEFHLELRGVREFVQAHEITEDLVDKIKTRLPNAEVLIHADPEGGR